MFVFKTIARVLTFCYQPFEMIYISTILAAIIKNVLPVGWSEDLIWQTCQIA